MIFNFTLIGFKLIIFFIHKHKIIINVINKRITNQRIYFAIFCKSDTVSKAIIRLAERQRLEICHVKQGYPACTTLAFGNNAITADAGMADALSRKGVKVTLINNGDISLPPYEYGFIGGASAVYENKVYFLGDLSTHRDGVKIRSAIESAGYKVISLSDEPLSDLGGIIFL